MVGEALALVGQSGYKLNPVSTTLEKLSVVKPVRKAVVKTAHARPKNSKCMSLSPHML